MIVDLPDTTTNEINENITALREEEGAITLGRVLTLVIVAESEDLAKDAIDASVWPARTPPDHRGTAGRPTRRQFATERAARGRN